LVRGSARQAQNSPAAGTWDGRRGAGPELGPGIPGLGGRRLGLEANGSSGPGLESRHQNYWMPSCSIPTGQPAGCVLSIAHASGPSGQYSAPVARAHARARLRARLRVCGRVCMRARVLARVPPPRVGLGPPCNLPLDGNDIVAHFGQRHASMFFSFLLDSLRGSSVKFGTIQRILSWPLRKDDTHKSRSVTIFKRQGFCLGQNIFKS
jgi:hypothetical protein